MIDNLPFWSMFLRWLGWNVSQEFQVMQFDHQKAAKGVTTGMPTAKDAAEQCDVSKGQWVRRTIEIWRD